MQCDRCQGLLIHEDSLSVNNDYSKISYLRCVNCGQYLFVGGKGMTYNRSTHPRLPAAA